MSTHAPEPPLRAITNIYALPDRIVSRFWRRMEKYVRAYNPATDTYGDGFLHLCKYVAPTAAEIGHAMHVRDEVAQMILRGSGQVLTEWQRDNGKLLLVELVMQHTGTPVAAAG